MAQRMHIVWLGETYGSEMAVGGGELITSAGSQSLGTLELALGLTRSALPAGGCHHNGAHWFRVSATFVSAQAGAVHPPTLKFPSQLPSAALAKRRRRVWGGRMASASEDFTVRAVQTHIRGFIEGVHYVAAQTVGDGACGLHAVFGAPRRGDGALECDEARRSVTDRTPRVFRMLLNCMVGLCEICVLTS